MKRRKRILLLAAAVLMAALCLSGCGTYVNDDGSGFLNIGIADAEDVLTSTTDGDDITGLNFIIVFVQRLDEMVFGTPADDTERKRIHDLYSASDTSIDFGSGNGEWAPINVAQNAGETVSTVLNYDAIVGDGDSGATIAAVTQTVKHIGFAIMFIIWMFETINTMTEMRLTAESFLKCLLHLGIATLFLTYAMDITSAFMELGSAMFKGIKLGTMGYDSASLDGLAVFEGGQVIKIGVSIAGISTGLWVCPQALFGLLLMIFPAYFTLWCDYKIIECLVIRVLGLIVRIIMSPVSMSFDLGNGLGAAMANYLKDIISCALQPTIVIVACAAIGMVGTALNSIFGATEGSTPVILYMVLVCMQLIILGNFIGKAEMTAKQVMH